MINEINIEFGQGKRLSAVSDKYKIDVDLPKAEGGLGKEPAPLDLFLASLATCAGQYACIFCESRSLSMEGMGLKVRYRFNDEGNQINKFSYELTIPDHFPEKYKAALLRALDLCPIKKLLMNPPAFELEIV